MGKLLSRENEYSDNSMNCDCLKIEGSYSTISRAVLLIDGKPKTVRVKKTKRDATQSFSREVDGLEWNKHPDIVEIFGSDKKIKEIYLEEIEGTPYNIYLQKNGKVPLNTCMELFSNMTKPIAYIHSSTTEKPAFVHYDVSDNNYIINGTKVKLLDFGTCFRKENIPKEFYCYTVGTPLYLSPEKILKNPECGQASDIYGLGVVMYRTITGMHPFDPCLGKMEHQILKCRPLDVQSGDKHVDEIIMSCLEKNAVNRPKISELERFFSDRT
jgi:serine/threonine protein kinase